MAAGRPLSVFISYASADRARAQKLHAQLSSMGADAWIDTEDILPGQEWKMAISKALEETDLVLLCLSNHSVSREGYVQKEMRLALDRALQIPPGEIFLIPARFEEVELPYSLRDYQAVDLFTENGMNKLLQSLNHRAEKVNARSLSFDSPPVEPIKEKAVKKKNGGSKSPLGKVEIHIHGDVRDSNIVVGSDNTAGNDTNNEKDL